MEQLFPSMKFTSNRLFPSMNLSSNWLKYINRAND
uniref:Uncharacterized protein n=1 Tax=Nelumbo nucifera TaxID=4432 RepID=A0A822ZVC5_NELNU|nr:TPA_asm: hypothetical protein HUJ06_004088 [Nelumbo nucifera]